MPTWTKRIVFAILIATILSITTFGIYLAISNETESEQTATGTETIATTTTTESSTTTTIEPVVTTTSSTSTTTSTTPPTTTTTTTIPEPADPPASGLYIVDEEFYGEGIAVFGRDFPDIGIHEDRLIVVDFSLPIGAKIYAPFGGEMSEQGPSYFGNNVDIMSYPENKKESLYFDVSGDGLRFKSSGHIKAGEVVAVVTDDGFNVKIFLGRFDENLGYFMPDDELFAEYFSYIVVFNE